MTIVKLSTKKGQELLSNAMNNEGYKLRDVYSTYSDAKDSAYRSCLNEYVNTDNTENFHICSHSCFTFSVAWDITSPDTGEILFTRLETAYNSYLIDHNA